MNLHYIYYKKNNIAYLLAIALILIFKIRVTAQTLPSSRSVDWTLAGLKDMPTKNNVEVDLQLHGFVGDGTTPNDVMMDNVLSSVSINDITTLLFPTGNFLFNETINLPSNVVLKGQGPENTMLSLDLGGTGEGIRIRGAITNTSDSMLTQAAAKDDTVITVQEINDLAAGDWIKIVQDDSDLVTSSWALNTVGQIVQIQSIENNEITLVSPLRMGYELSRNPYVKKMVPNEHVGIECLKIDRLDNTLPSHTSNISFENSVNCWVDGVESSMCNFSHIDISNSSNIYITRSYMYDAFDYGGGGRAYGVMIHFTSNECLIENNIFEHLRHAMILQAGANGNVFSYNYSLDPFWTSVPSNATGDMVLHGNYPYANLFEHNINRNIVIDNSHGPNGPHNTFLRNRAEGYGIFFSANNSPGQNFLGNDISNTNIPYSLVNYTILGNDHFIYGNNNKGTIDPQGTESLVDLSYVYPSRPSFITEAQWASIGTPNTMGEGTIPAYNRYNSGNLFEECNDTTASTAEAETLDTITIYPNPAKDVLFVESNNQIQTIKIHTILGQEMYSEKSESNTHSVKMENWDSGIYFIQIVLSNFESKSIKFIKK